MKIDSIQQCQRGYALVSVLGFAAISMVTLGGALSWTATNARTTDRNNRYFAALAAAEAATEKVVTRISRDYQNDGESGVYNNLATYATLVPKVAEHPYWGDYTFSNGSGTAGRTHVSRITSWGYTDLTSQYAGLKGMAATYRIISNAKTDDLSGTQPMTAALKQEVQVASIPVFQFAIFYSMDLEINPGPDMTITGRVHGNANIYSEPVNTLTYQNHVTAVGDIVLEKSPLDPSNRSVGTVQFNKEHDGRVSSLTLPIGTNNSPAAVHSVVEIPPGTESPTSLMGKQRYYNKADLVITVKNSGVTAKSGSFDNFSTSLGSGDYNKFLDIGESFYDKREGKTVKAVEIDVADLKKWAETNTVLRPLLSRDLNSLYVDDQRSQTSSTMPGVRLVNGTTLPSKGLTIATPDPVYIKGHYNAHPSHQGSSNTSLTKPASIVADSITILSQSWNDSNSTKSLANRVATHTTVNAAFLAGIVPSNGIDYSGGVENFPRFLENWSNKIFTYNGSMVVMYESVVADAPWGNSDVYGAPNRNWAFDVNFMDVTKLPPGTPQLLTLVRGVWQIIPPDQIL